MNPFKGHHFPKEIIMTGIRWYVSYSLSYRQVKEFLEERGISVDHATINRWVVKFSPILEKRFRKNKKTFLKSWRMDETYIKVKGKWHYYYRAVDKEGKTIDFYLSRTRDKKAAKFFLQKAIWHGNIPIKINVDKYMASFVAIQNINEGLSESEKIEITQIKMKNQIIEQDHRFIKKITKPMLGFKSFISAEATLKGIELNHMLRKRQSKLITNFPVWKQFYALVG